MAIGPWIDITPNAVIAFVLMATGTVVYLGNRRHTAHRAFALFLYLIGLNYLLGGISNAFIPTTYSDAVPRPGIAHHLNLAAFICGILDPVALLWFAGEYPKRNRLANPRIRGVAVAVSAIFLARLAIEPQAIVWIFGSWRPWLETYVTATYFLVLGWFLYNEFRARASDKPLFPRGFLLGWLVVVAMRVSPGLALVNYVKSHVSHLESAYRSLTTFLVDASVSLVIIGLLFLLVRSLTGPDKQREVNALFMRAATAVVAIVAVLATPFILGILVHGPSLDEGALLNVLRKTSRRMVFSVRWIFFAGVVGPTLLSNQVLPLDARLRRNLVASTVAGVLFILFLAGVGVIEQNLTDNGTLPAEAVVLLGVLVLLGTQSAQVGRRVGNRFFPPDEARDAAYWKVRRLETYRRAAAAASRDGTPPEELERLRHDLGLTRDEARLAAEAVGPGATEPLAPGVVLAHRYEIRRPLGRGGHGRVFLARDRRDACDVAVKEVDPGEDASAAARIEREVTAAAKLKHPRLLPARDYFVAGGSAFVVTDHMPGGSLADRLKNEGVLAPPEATRMVLDVLGGLEAAHAAGVLHRDVKPANVLLDADGRARLGDFGIALVQEAGHTATSLFDPRVPGTMAYLPPEALDGAKPDARWDVYAVGTLLLEAVTGRTPPPGSPASDTLPHSLRRVIDRARHADPQKRFASAAEMRRAVAEATGQRV